jgi:serine protease
MKDGVLQNTIIPGNITENDYLLFMGTSMASPHVAGVAALIIGSGVTDPDAVEKVLKDSARPPRGDHGQLRSGPENRYGAGIIDAAAALKVTTFDHGSYELGLALAGAALLLLRLRRAGRLAQGLGVGGLVALLVGSSGLFFLPRLGVPGATFLTQGLPAWDLAFGVAAHGNPLFYSALIPLAATLLLYSKKGLRGILAGLALGVAAHLAFHAVIRTSDVRFVPDLLDSTWLLANAGLSFLLGFAILRK